MDWFSNTLVNSRSVHFRFGMHGWLVRIPSDAVDKFMTRDTQHLSWDSKGGGRRSGGLTGNQRRDEAIQLWIEVERRLFLMNALEIQSASFVSTSRLKTRYAKNLKRKRGGFAGGRLEDFPAIKGETKPAIRHKWLSQFKACEV